MTAPFLASEFHLTSLQAGAGPAGLAVALTLLKNNVPMRIIEKDAQFHNGTRGPAVQVSV